MVRAASDVRVTFAYDEIADALTSSPEEHSPARQAYETLRARLHYLVLTAALEQAYQDWGRKNPSLVTRVIAQLNQECKGRIIRRRRGGLPPDVPGLGGWHKEVFYEAIQTRSNYLITHWQPWLNLSRTMEREHGLAVMQARAYVERHK
jgi:hypothetical protein